MKKGWIQAIDGATQEDVAPKTTADLVYVDSSLDKTVQQALPEEHSIDAYTHTYDSEHKMHDLEGEGTVGWIRVTAPFTPGDMFSVNGKLMYVHAPRHDPRLFCFEPGRTVVFTVKDDSIDFLTNETHINVQDVELYGVRIDKADPNPATRCTYLYDAEGKRPAKMIYDTGGNSFDYGDWGDVGFVQDNRPVMLRSNGEVAYALDPSNVAQKVGGGASDISNTGFAGNAMSEIPRWWLKQYEDKEYQYILLSNLQLDEDFHAYAFTRDDGTLADHVYLPMYRGCNFNGKLRSLSGLQPTAGQTVADEVSRAEANGACWGTKSWAQVDYLNALLIMISCSTDHQTVFGKGCCRSVNEWPLSGRLDTNGQFFGYNNDDVAGVKVFWCEDWWGRMEDRITGMVMQSGRVMVKMTPPYNLQGDGYIDTGVSPAGTNGYITAMHFSKYGKIPSAAGAGGSDTTYWSDYLLWSADNDPEYPLYAMVGGDSYDQRKAGPFCLQLDSHIYMASSYGASLSALP